MKKKRFALNIVFHLVLLIAVCAIIYPFVFMISGAFKTDFEMNRHITQLIPREITLDHFHTLFESIPFITQFLKSPAASYASTLLLCGANEGPLEGGSIAAKTAQLFLIDILYAEVYRLMGEKAEENKKKTSQMITEKMM